MTDFMETPICDFVRRYADSEKMRLHMPGHKGHGPLGVEHLDITEVEGADVLYDAKDIILKSEENASKLFGSAKTVYSTEGSSLSIRAMLYLAVIYARSQNKRPIIVAGRNSHKVFMSAAALLDIDVEWLYTEERDSVISCNITPEALCKVLGAMSEKPTAVYITSPDYLGNVSDIEGLADVCHKNGCLLLVDNAHGAYLNFLPESRHPLALGADMCCDSAHKTLGVLTGGGYLHISKYAPDVFGEMAEKAMSIFASTSPSYLILQSLDAANGYISDGYRERLDAFSKRVCDLRKRLEDIGYVCMGDEPLKLTIFAKAYGYYGYELSSILLKKDIVCEFADPDFTVMMLTPELGISALARIEAELIMLEKKEPIKELAPMPRGLKRAMPLREAVFSVGIEMPIERCEDRILVDMNIACPPAIPIAICGEILSIDAIKCMKYYGITKCRVLK